MFTPLRAVALATGLGVAGLATPASATLQLFLDVSGTTFACGDNAACDSNPTLGLLQVVGPTTINGVRIFGELDSSSGTPANPGLNFLNSSVLSVFNTTNILKTVQVVVSDTDFSAPTNSFAIAAAGTWQSSVGSSITFDWFNDAGNAQGANSSGNTPGTLVGTFTQTATTAVQGFSYNNTGNLPFNAPFSMTERATYTLQPGGTLLNRGQTEISTAIPETSTWAMMLLGFAALGFVGSRKQNTAHLVA